MVFSSFYKKFGPYLKVYADHDRSPPSTPFPSSNISMGPTIAAVAVVIILAAVPAFGCSSDDRATLLEFRSSLSESNHGIFKTWTAGRDCSAWYGVSCDPATGRVAGIDLRGESEDPIFAGGSGHMTGTISPAVCRLRGLTSLVVADWKGISGPIPSCIPTSLPDLRILDLVGNSLTGEIPADVGKLSRLRVLNLADNQIAGEFPASVAGMRDLKHLDLSDNQLSGEIPADIGSMQMLSRVLLARNQLSGPIPSSISAMRRLADLDLSDNQLSGSIPPSLGGMPVLATLYLARNRISGKIPAGLLANQDLSSVNLSRNAIEGQIPDAFGGRSYFTMLDLSYNKLSGAVPKSITGAAYVGHLDLSHNHLCGPIPAGKPIEHLEAPSFAGNDCLCGMPLLAC